MAKALDVEVAAFRSRSLDGGPYPYLWLDALSVKAREDGRVASVATVVATAVSSDGHREILGLDTFTAEDGAAWTRFLKGLVARGLSGVRLVISDDHQGLTGAIAAVLPRCAWQRCRTCFMRNVLCQVPRSAQPLVATLVRTIFAQPSAEEGLNGLVPRLEVCSPQTVLRPHGSRELQLYRLGSRSGGRSRGGVAGPAAVIVSSSSPHAVSSDTRLSTKTRTRIPTSHLDFFIAIGSLLICVQKLSEEALKKRSWYARDDKLLLREGAHHDPREEHPSAD